MVVRTDINDISASNVLYRMQDAADYLAVHDNTLRKWMKLPDFPVEPLKTIGGESQFTREMLDEVKRWKHPAA